MTAPASREQIAAARRVLDSLDLGYPSVAAVILSDAIATAEAYHDEVERLRQLVDAKQSWIDGAKVDAEADAEARTAHAALVADLRALCDSADAAHRPGVVVVTIRALLDRHAPEEGS